MRKLIVKLIVTAFGLWLADSLLSGVTSSGYQALLVAALVLGLVNAIVRPVIFLLTIPITVVTFGLFLLVINGAMVILVSRWVNGFTVDSLGPAVATAIIVGGTNMLLAGETKPKPATTDRDR
jgi:putative membrane protein